MRTLVAVPIAAAAAIALTGCISQPNTALTTASASSTTYVVSEHEKNLIRNIIDGWALSNERRATVVDQWGDAEDLKEWSEEVEEGETWEDDMRVWEGLDQSQHFEYADEYADEKFGGKVDITEDEQAALEAAYPDRNTYKASHLAELLYRCYEPEYADSKKDSVLQGALVLCPDKKHIKKTITDKQEAKQRREERQRLRKQGAIVDGDGTYRVGKDIQPGTYVSHGSDCYWARNDSAGNIIDNNFINGYTRAQVTVSSGDYSFHSSGCGTWKRQ